MEELHPLADIKADTMEELPVLADITADTMEELPVLADIKADTMEELPPLADIKADTMEELPPLADIKADTMEELPPLADIKADTVEELPPLADIKDDTMEELPPLADIKADTMEELPVLADIKADTMEELPPLADIKADTMEELHPLADIKDDAMMEWRTVEIRDEKGDGFDTVQCEDMVFPKQFLHIQPEVRMKNIKELKYRDGDVFICSYPKTGTHWVFNLVHYLMTPGPVEQKLLPSPRLLDLHPLTEIEQLPSPRLAITHLKPNRLPMEHLQKRGKIILVARNPRDTMVSHMYHTQRHEVFNFSKLSWNCFFENWVKGQIPTGSYFDYYNTWEKTLQEQSENLNVHIVFYENLIKDGIGELRKIQQFLGLNNTEERLNQILDRCSWRRIKVDVNTGDNNAQSEKSELSRKGVIGHWRSKFTVTQDEVFNKVIEEKFKNSMFNRPVQD